MAATTIFRTRTRFRPPKIRLHCRLKPYPVWFPCHPWHKSYPVWVSLPPLAQELSGIGVWTQPWQVQGLKASAAHFHPNFHSVPPPSAGIWVTSPPTIVLNFRCVPLEWSGSGSVIHDHSDHSKSNEPMNPCPEWIHRFIWSNMIRGYSDHWSWSGSSQRNAPFDSWTEIS